MATLENLSCSVFARSAANSSMFKSIRSKVDGGEGAAHVRLSTHAQRQERHDSVAAALRERSTRPSPQHSPITPNLG